jgi:hypothetical protein
VGPLSLCNCAMKLCIEGDIYFIPKVHILETGTVKLSIETGLEIFLVSLGMRLKGQLVFITKRIISDIILPPLSTIIIQIVLHT